MKRALFLAAMAVFAMQSCRGSGEKGGHPSFDILFTDILAVVDNPDSARGATLRGTRLERLCDDSADVDGMKESVVVYGRGTKAKAGGEWGAKYSSRPDDHAMALRIVTLSDPEVYIDFRSRDDADAYYKEILERGVVQEQSGLLFVTEQKLQSGITKLAPGDYAKYERMIHVSPPREIMKGWHTIAFVN